MTISNHLLALPALYSLLQYVLAGRYKERYVESFIRPIEGMRVLDVGCGPGDIVAYLPAAVEYVGFDISASYIEAARRRFEGRKGRPKCEFFCGALTNAALDNFDKFDVVTANSVLHHLVNDEAASLFVLAKKVLRPSGRLITLDPCYVENQSLISHFLLSRDRGKFIRTEDQYRTLASKTFPQIMTTVLYDLLRVPYTNIVMECTK